MKLNSITPFLKITQGVDVAPILAQQGVRRWFNQPATTQTTREDLMLNDVPLGYDSSGGPAYG